MRGKHQCFLIMHMLFATLFLWTGCTIEVSLTSINPRHGDIAGPNDPGSGNPPTPAPTPQAGEYPFIAEFFVNSSGDSITLPLRSDMGFGYDVTVDWGDGTYGSFKSDDGQPITHIYSSSGSYTVRFWGDSEAFSFGENATSASQMTSVISLGNLGWKSLEGAFAGTSQLSSFSVGANSETNEVVSFKEMFKGSSISNLNLTALDTSAATNYDGMFEGAAGITTLDVSGLDISRTKSLNSMFKEMSVLTTLDMTGWDTSEIEDMSHLFNGAGMLNPTISHFNFTNLLDGEDMFKGTSINTSTYDTFLDLAIATATNNQVQIGDIPAGHSYTLERIKSRYQLTASTGKFWGINDLSGSNEGIILRHNLAIGTHNIRIPVKSHINSDMSSFETGTINSTTYQNDFEIYIDGTLYGRYTNRNGAMGTWTNNTMYSVDLAENYSVAQSNTTTDANILTISVVADTAREYEIELRGIVQRFGYLHGNCQSSLVSVPSLGSTGLRSLHGAFTGCTGLRWVGFGNLSNVTNLAYAFSGASNLEVVDTYRWNVSNVLNMEELFSSAGNLEVVSFKNWDTKKVKKVRGMFLQATKLNPDLSTFDFSGIIPDYSNSSGSQWSMRWFLSQSGIDNANVTKLLIRLANPVFGLQPNKNPDWVSASKLNLDGVGAGSARYSSEACSAVDQLDQLFTGVSGYESNSVIGVAYSGISLQPGHTCPP